MIEGETTLERLDLVGQQKQTDLTRRWLKLFLRDPRLQTEAVRGHARLLFPDFEFSEKIYTDAGLLAELRPLGLTFRDYFCYLLLDFASVDPELELEPLRIGFALVSELKWADRLEALAVKELKLKKREVQELRLEATKTAGNDAAEIVVSHD